MFFCLRRCLCISLLLLVLCGVCLRVCVGVRVLCRSSVCDVRVVVCVGVGVCTTMSILFLFDVVCVGLCVI